VKMKRMNVDFLYNFTALKDNFELKNKKKWYFMI